MDLNSLNVLPTFNLSATQDDEMTKQIFRRGFKTEANKYAREFRDELNLKAHEPLCPWLLAHHLCIPVYKITEYLGSEIPQYVDYFTKIDKKYFSAVTLFHGSRRIIIHNDYHHHHRQASNIAHELSHGILGHPPTCPLNNNGQRNVIDEHENEANWLGPTLLVSEEAALHIAQNDISVDNAVGIYKVSKDVIRFRLNVTAARKRAKKR